MSSTIAPELLEKLKMLSKDDESLKELEILVGSFAKEANSLKQQLELLEGAIRNDYNSILITELTLESPGPKIVYVNNGFTKMTGYTKEDTIGNTPRMLQGPKTDRAILDRLKRRLIEGQAFFGHTINYRKDGSEFINQWDIHPLMNDAGEVTHWVSYQRDVTEKRETAKAIFNTDFDSILKRREEFNAKFVRNEEGEITCKYINEAYAEITGIETSIVLDNGLYSFIHDDDVAVIANGLEKAFDGTESTEKCRYKMFSGEYVLTIQSFKPIVNQSTQAIDSVKSVVKLELLEV